MYYITEFLSGGLITVLFSYTASFYFQYPSYIKIVAFLWGMPLLYFYILFISLSISETAALDITRHGMYGIMCSIIAMTTTFLLLSYLYAGTRRTSLIIGYNVLFLLVVISIYIYYNLYESY